MHVENIVKNANPTIAFYGLPECFMCFSFQQQTLSKLLPEVQIFVRRRQLGTFMIWCSTFICAAFEVVFRVKMNRGRKQIVHHDKSNVLSTTLHCHTKLCQ